MMTALPFRERITASIDQACEAAGIGRTKLYELIGAGKVQTVIIGRRRLVVVESLITFLQGQVIHTQQQHHV
jgi:excisionase family DNA binding protein